ncbi:hypothetical protein N656DRAFT_784890 [Canariomyces notabilis]|uniref:Uncharacterized protein n=1 Tax=Canariomyces notabilis TaxID=2074819 RepID=A0AAN6QHY3_9PEZI|nr:hypothetical protein N656DRAFT_784890 [Canariomyces arenarius]
MSLESRLRLAAPPRIPYPTAHCSWVGTLLSSLNTLISEGFPLDDCKLSPQFLVSRGLPAASLLGHKPLVLPH